MIKKKMLGESMDFFFKGCGLVTEQQRNERVIEADVLTSLHLLGNCLFPNTDNCRRLKHSIQTAFIQEILISALNRGVYAKSPVRVFCSFLMFSHGTHSRGVSHSRTAGEKSQ